MTLVNCLKINNIFKVHGMLFLVLHVFLKYNTDIRAVATKICLVFCRIYAISIFTLWDKGFYSVPRGRDNKTT